MSRPLPRLHTSSLKVLYVIGTPSDMSVHLRGLFGPLRHGELGEAVCSQEKGYKRGAWINQSFFSSLVIWFQQHIITFMTWLFLWLDGLPLCRSSGIICNSRNPEMELLCFEQSAIQKPSLHCWPLSQAANDRLSLSVLSTWKTSSEETPCLGRENESTGWKNLSKSMFYMGSSFPKWVLKKVGRESTNQRS